MNEGNDMNDERTQQAAIADKNPRIRAMGIALAALVVVVAGVLTWWTLIRDDNSGTTAQVSVSGDETGSGGGVGIIQIPSLAATATIDGVPADGPISPIDVVFGTPSELVVTVVNDGNITMDDITVTLEIAVDDASNPAVPEPCALPVLGPADSSDCTLEFTPTESMTAVTAKILGYGPQRQEVELSVNIAFGS